MTTSLRYPGGLEPSNPVDLVDNLSACFNRCKAVVDLIRAVKESEDAQVMDDTISNACWSVLADLEDGQATLDGWRERTRSQPQDERQAFLRRALTDILRPEYPNEEALAAEVDKRLRERLGVPNG